MTHDSGLHDSHDGHFINHHLHDHCIEHHHSSSSLWSLVQLLSVFPQSKSPPSPHHRHTIFITMVGITTIVIIISVITTIILIIVASSPSSSSPSSSSSSNYQTIIVKRKLSNIKHQTSNTGTMWPNRQAWLWPPTCGAWVVPSSPYSWPACHLNMIQHFKTS